MSKKKSPSALTKSEPKKAKIEHPRKIFTRKVCEEICRKIETGLTVRQVVHEMWPELDEDSTPKFTHRLSGAMRALLFGDPEVTATYRRARRMNAHSNIDRAVDELENAIDKDSAYSTRVKSDILLRTAEAWSPQEFGRAAIPGGGMNIQIITPLGTPDMQNLPQAGYNIVIPDTRSGDIPAQLSENSEEKEEEPD